MIYGVLWCDNADDMNIYLQELFFKPQPAMQFNNTVIYLKVDFPADMNFVFTDFNLISK